MEKPVATQTSTSESTTTSRQWFDEKQTGSIDKELLKPAREVVDSHESFRAQFKDLFDWRSLPNSRNAVQQQIDELILSKEPDIHTLKHAATASFGEALWKSARHQGQRKRGWRKVGATAQRFVSTFAEFFGAYASFVDLLKSADPVFGRAAYESLSIFMMVVMNKTENDNKITDLLQEIRRSFPHLDIWLTLYPTHPMKVAVVQVYKHVIEFTRQASRYFTSFWTRVGKAIGSPPSIGVDRKVAMIQGSLAEVNGQAMVHLHERSHDTHSTVIRSEQKVDGLTARNAELRKQLDIIIRANDRLEARNDELKREMDEQRLAELRQKLTKLKDLFDIELLNDECDIRACQRCHSKAFAAQGSSPRLPRLAYQYTRMSWDLLESQTEYQTWHASETSSLLVISGRTIGDSRSSKGYTHSWLSPATVLVASRLREQKEVVAFYTCHSKPRAEPCATKRLFFSVICQILETEPSVLQNAYEQLIAAKTDHEAAIDNEDELDILTRLLMEVLGNIKRPVTIILDSIEWCDHDLADIMEKLIDMVLSDGIFVKFMLVIDPSGGNRNKNGFWDSKSALRRARNRQVAAERVHTLNLDQEREKASSRQLLNLGEKQ